MRLWPASIRARLTLWYTAIFGALLVIFALASFEVMQNELWHRNDRYLEEARGAVVNELRTEELEHASTLAAVREALDEVRFRDVDFAVFDTGMSLLDTSWALPPAVTHAPGAHHNPQLHPAELASILRTMDPAEPMPLEYSNADGHFLVRTGPIVVHGTPLLLAATEPMRSYRETLEAVGTAYAVAIPLLLLLAAVGGNFMARRSLEPVQRMSRQAAAISARNLHERLPEGPVHDELGELARIINGLLHRLQQSFAQQRRFMADASHELRTPVAIMRAEADVALSQPTRSEAAYRESLEVVQDAGRRLARIVEDLFLLARADAGHQPVRRAPLYLDEVVMESVRAVRAIATRRGVRIELGEIADAPAEGDEELLGRLLLNLLDNALRYTPAGGTVRVALESAGDAYRVRVVDQGPGIPDEARDQIFERFYRVDRARSREETLATSGAGLGLAIARWIAESHGGRLALARTDGTGSEFCLTIPTPRGQRPAAAAPAAEPVEAGRR